MKRTIEIPEDLDSKIQSLHEAWDQYEPTSYAETVRVLLTLGLDAIATRENREKRDETT